MHVWIDLSNSPHPLLFAPVIERFEDLGHRVSVTARDNAQTAELALERWPSAEIIGGPSPPGRRAKAETLAARVNELRGWARRARPDVALSHNSYAQLVAAKWSSVPAVTAMDFEHQPANHVGFRLAQTILLPAAMRETSVARMGATSRKTRWYPGLKEEVYLGDFVPDASVRRAAGVAPGRTLVVARTPPSRALYHDFESPLFMGAIQAAASAESADVVVLARHPEQREQLAGLGLPTVHVPEKALDSRSLMYEADLVLGAGGTMTREAALLGVPTFSLFAGETPAVDRWLEQRGMMRRLRTVDDMLPIKPRSGDAASPDHLRERSRELVEHFVSATLETAGASRLVDLVGR